jgi:mono/diheme cytochrome c family protein
MRSCATLVAVLAFACTPSTDPEPAAPKADTPVVVDPGEPADAPTAPVEEPVEDPAEVWQISGPRSASGSLVVFPSTDISMVADDEGFVHLLGDEWRRTVDVQGEATRLVRVGDAVAVTLREEGEVAWFRLVQGDLEAGPRAYVGTEPFDVVASSDRLYVSLSLDDAVVELDAATLVETRRWSVAGEPRWLTLDGDTLYAASARLPHVTRIDLAGGQSTLTLPTPQRFGDACGDRVLTGRITGEMQVGVRGDLYVPTLYVDTQLQGTPLGGLTDDACQDAVDATVPGLYDAPLYGAGGGPERAPMADRINAVVTVFGAGDVRLVNAAAVRTTCSDPVPTRTVRSAPTSVALANDGTDDTRMWVTLEGSKSLVLLDLTEPLDGQLDSPFENWSRTAFPVGADGSVRVDPADPDHVWTSSWLDRSVRAYDRDEMDALLALAADFTGLGFPLVPIPFSGAAQTRDLPVSTLPADVLRGRALFHDANDTRMAHRNASLSCATCHAEGRDDGTTWQFADLDRQTPPLHQAVDTAPYSWTDQVETLDAQVATSIAQMGGSGLDAASIADLAAYLGHLRAPMSPEPTSPADVALVDLGRQLFSDAGCVGCHQGSAATDGLDHVLFGTEPLGTPSLVGLVASAPYLHDGSARTLRALVDLAADEGMGDADALNDAERDALVAYLRTL